MRIYSRELIESPPVEVFAAAYFKYEPPEEALPQSDAGGKGEAREWECPLPDVTE